MKAKAVTGVGEAVARALDAALEAMQLPEAWELGEKGNKIVGRFVEVRRYKRWSRDGEEGGPVVFILRVEDVGSPGSSA